MGVLRQKRRGRAPPRPYTAIGSAAQGGKPGATIGVRPGTAGDGRPRRAAPTQGWVVVGTNGISFCGSLAAGAGRSPPLHG